MRHHARFCALVFLAFVFTVSADFNRALAQTPTPTPTTIQAGQVIISEFRLRGPAGVEDEFVELYNNTDQDIFVQATDTTGGWTVAVSNGQITGPIFTIPNGTRIPARGHLLGANVNGYSLSGYPSGNPTPVATPTPTPTLPFATATPDRTWDFDVPDGSGVALFSTTNGTSLNAATRLDAAGFANSPALYKEGGGIPSVVTANVEHTYYRDLSQGTPRDTADNAADFRLVGTSPGIQVTRLGAPGPENLASPIVNNTTIVPTLLDPAVSSTSPPNRERRPNVEPNADLGTLLFRKTITNNTGLPVSRLRFRIVTITTLGSPASECSSPSCADLRALTSQDGEAAVGGQIVTVRGVRLEEPPEQPAGGGYNSSLSADFITLATPLLPGQSINVVFKLGVMRSGPFRLFFNIEAQTFAQVILSNGPAASRVGLSGGTDFTKGRLIIDTNRAAPATPPVSPAAAPGDAPSNFYVPWFINLTPSRAADDKADREDEGKEKKRSEEATPAAVPAPQAVASDAQTDAAAEPTPQSLPSTTRRGPQKRRPAAAKARPDEKQ